MIVSTVIMTVDVLNMSHLEITRTKPLLHASQIFSLHMKTQTHTRRERERKSALLLLASFIRNDPPARQVESWVTQTVAAKALLFGLD